MKAFIIIALFVTDLFSATVHASDVSSTTLGAASIVGGSTASGSAMIPVLGLAGATLAPVLYATGGLLLLTGALLHDWNKKEVVLRKYGKASEELKEKLSSNSQYPISSSGKDVQEVADLEIAMLQQAGLQNEIQNEHQLAALILTRTDYLNQAPE